MIDPLLVTRKLALMREHLTRLRRRRPEAVDQLRADEDRLDALSMSVLVVVQEAIGLAFHIASDDRGGRSAAPVADAGRTLAGFHPSLRPCTLACVKAWKLGSAADNARFIRERARSLVGEEGLRVAEELRATTYDDPESPPRLERVFVLSRGPSSPVRRHRRARARDAG